MQRCSDQRDLSELDPVTFFIVTEIIIAEREALLAESVEDLCRQVA